MENLFFNTNLPHIYNSCGINSLFIALAQLKLRSNDELIDDMIRYCSTKRKLDEMMEDQKHGLDLMVQFYKKFNIDHGYQNVRLLLTKIYDSLIFGDSQIEIGDDYEKISLTKKVILLDMEQTKSMTDYNKQFEDKTNKIVTHGDEDFNNVSILKFNDIMYVPCLYIVCLGNHYITLINTKAGLIVYNDLDRVKIINQDEVKKILISLSNSVEFIGYINFKSN